MFVFCCVLPASNKSRDDDDDHGVDWAKRTLSAEVCRRPWRKIVHEAVNARIEDD